MTTLKFPESIQLLVVVAGYSVQTSKDNESYVRLEFESVNNTLTSVRVGMNFFTKALKPKWVVGNPLVLSLDKHEAYITGYLDDNNIMVEHTKDSYELTGCTQATYLSINRHKEWLSEDDIVDLKAAIKELTNRNLSL